MMVATSSSVRCATLELRCTARNPASRLSPPIVGSVRQVDQQERLCDADPFELGQVQALIGAVGTGVRVLDAGDQHAGRGERLEELRDERDRATDTHVDRRGAVPGLGERVAGHVVRSEEHTSELPSLMRISYAVFCLKKKKK